MFFFPHVMVPPVESSTNTRPLEHLGLSSFIVKHRKLGHVWHSTQCKTPETSRHWSTLNLREFLSSPSSVWQTCRSRTNAVKKLHHPLCAFVWCALLLQPWKEFCEWIREPRLVCCYYAGIWHRMSVLIQPFFCFDSSSLAPPFRITSRVWEEALRMGIFQRSASDCLPLHHDISIILIPCKWFGGFFRTATCSIILDSGTIANTNINLERDIVWWSIFY